MQAILVKNLTKVYKTGKKALSDLSLEVQQGEVFTLLGSNGAGKSTLINILNTSSDFTSGEVAVLGKPLTEQNYIRRNIGCVSQHVSLFEHLTLEENLKFQGRLFGQNKEEIKKSTRRFIDAFQLQDFTDKVVSVYSGGVRRRIDIAMSMISRPKLLFMDEPTVALDIISRKALWDTIRTIKDEFGTTIFLTTHYLEVE